MHQDTLDACCRDLCILTSQLARHRKLDSSLLRHATVTTGTPRPVSMFPVVVDHPGFTSVPDGARYPHTVQPVTTSLLPADTDEALQNSAQELFTDPTNQFGLE
ncbi:hypothetical protein HFP71_33170 [Streptomyces sp. ARC32]